MASSPAEMAIVVMSMVFALAVFLVGAGFTYRACFGIIGAKRGRGQEKAERE